MSHAWDRVTESIKVYDKQAFEALFREEQIQDAQVISFNGQLIHFSAWTIWYEISIKIFLRHQGLDYFLLSST